LPPRPVDDGTMEHWGEDGDEHEQGNETLDQDKEDKKRFERIMGFGILNKFPEFMILDPKIRVKVVCLRFFDLKKIITDWDELGEEDVGTRGPPKKRTLTWHGFLQAMNKLISWSACFAPQMIPMMVGHLSRCETYFTSGYNSRAIIKYSNFLRLQSSGVPGKLGRS
jgi:hypothetical protein